MSKSSYLTRIITLSIASAFAVVTMVACGGDDDDTGPVATSNGGSETTGQGGSTNATAGNGAAGTTAAACAQTTTCGGTECSTATLTSRGGCVQACCTADGKCGSQLKASAMMGGTVGICVAQNQQGPANASCPTYSKALTDAYAAAAAAAGIDAGAMGDIGDIGGGLMAYNGCCRPDGNCGFLVSSLGWGCVTATDIGNMMGESSNTGSNDEDITVTITPKTCK